MTTPVSPPTPPISPEVFVGIDVAKDTLDMARSDSGQLLSVPNTTEGFKRIIAQLAGSPITRIVLEATGGFEQPVLDALLDAGLPVSRVNPGHVRYFAKALGILAKTDALDAGVLVEFARRTDTRLAVKRPQIQAQLDALVTCRRQLVETNTQQSNRLQATSDKAARKAINSVGRVLEKQIKSLDQQIARLIDSDDDFKRLDEILQSAPGVADGLSASLIAELNELGQTGRREISALVGVAPFNHDSGKLKGKRAIRGGRAGLRCVLFMAARSAITHNPIIRNFAERLREKCKPDKVVVVACMHKLLSLLNVMVRLNITWDQLNVVKQFNAVTNAKIA